MAGDREIKLTILGDNRQAVAAIDGTETRLGGFKSALGSVSAVAGGFLAANVIAGGFQTFRGFIGGAIEDASQLEQSLGAVDQVFGTMADSIHRNAKNAADDLGLSRNAYNELATMSGTIFKGMGLDIETATEMTDELLGRGADLAAMFGGTPREAVERLNSAIIGNTEAVRSYGITLTAVDIQERALLDTGKERAADLTQAEKQQAAYALILERSADAAGQFARESDTAAGSAAREAAARENLSQQIGTYMLPLQVRWNEAKLAGVRIIAERVVPALAQLSAWIGSNVVPRLQEVADWMGPKLSAVAEVVVPKVQAAFGQLTAFAGEMAARFRSFAESDWLPALENVAAAARFVVDVVADHWPRIMLIVGPILAQVQNTIETVLGVISRLLAAWTNVIAGDWEGAWENLKRAAGTALNGIQETFRNGLDLLRGILLSVGQTFLEAGATVGGAIGKGILDGLANAGGAIGNFAQQVANALINIINSHVIDNINRALEFEIPLPFGQSFSVNAPDFPHIPTFGEGGVVPGRRGEPRLAIVHAGETILPTHRGGGGGAGGMTVNVHIAGSLVAQRELDEGIVRAVARAAQQGAFRGTPIAPIRGSA